ncbi:MFS transporter [Gorillibacterium sp. sgz5001074]|uniref:MFS transporter n=1 Tax=Gorillibacterium sp. sgz5001074 TaxID=3446695 RepID=UPI003F666A20
MNWKINLAVLWAGNFLVMAGMTMITPFLPLYLKTLGMADTHQVAVWGSLIFSVNFLSSFIFQPIWGSLADRFGRKMMLLRSGFGMAVIMALMGLATNAWHLLLLRFLNGTISGFVPAAIALLSANTPKNRIGFAMGTLQSGSVAGTILGPLIGGFLADTVGYRPIFYITGGLLFIASLLAMLLVRETFERKEVPAGTPKVSAVDGFRQLLAIRELPSLFTVCFAIQFANLASMPIMALYVEELHGTAANLAFMAGLVGSVNGFSNMLASPLLGRLSDKIGAQKVLMLALIGAALSLYPQSMAGNVWQLFAWRFLLGLFLGGLLPSVYALIRKSTPDGMESRSYSLNSSFLSLGNLLGPITGGLLSGYIGFRGIFVLSGSLMLVNALWVFVSLNRPRRENAGA